MCAVHRCGVVWCALVCDPHQFDLVGSTAQSKVGNV